MKKILLSIAVAACCSTAVRAQYTSDPSVNTNVVENVHNYGNYAVVSKQGILYSLTILPGQDAEGNSRLAYWVQVLDKEGNKILPGKGVMLCDYRNLTYTKVNQVLFADNDGNCLVMVSDCRNAPKGTLDHGYTVYKIGPDGKLLWKQGTDLADGTAFENVAAIKVVQVADGGYVFAYEVFSGDNNIPAHLRMEKLTGDGKKAWDDDVVLRDSKTPYTYPYIVDAGDNQVMLVYARGTGQYIMARLVDFDGSFVWDEDLKVYVGGFDSVPLHTIFNVVPAPEGAFVAWRDDRSYEGSFSNYVSYVKKDGTLGFPGGTNALKLSYASDYSRWVPSLVYNGESKSLYAFWRQFSQAHQTYAGLFVQRVSLEGELMWGPEGKAVIDMQQDVYVGYPTIQNAGGSDVAVFYQTNAINIVNSYVMKMDKDGNSLWSEPLNVSAVQSGKSDFEASALIDGSYWVTTWQDSRDSDESDADALYAQVVNIDGGFSQTTGIGAVAAGEFGMTDVYSIGGHKVTAVSGNRTAGLRPGLYIGRDKASGQARKFVVK